MFTAILIQILGLIAWLLLLISYWQKDINKILAIQLLSGVFSALHYCFLGAYEGMFIIVLELIRDYAYFKTNIDRYIFVGTIPIYIIYSLFSYHGIISLFPSISSLIDGYSLSYNKETAVTGAIFAEILWIIYDYVNGSYVGVITGILIIVSNIIVLTRNRCKKVK